MPELLDENMDRLRLAAQGDAGSWEALVSASRQRLRRMVAFRLDSRLRRLKEILSNLHPDSQEP